MMRALFSVIKWDAASIWIADNDAGGMSITNDAENVCQYIALNYPGRRIYYRDTEKQWSELVHNLGDFVRFEILTPGIPDRH